MADVLVNDEGSIVLLVPQTEAAEAWFNDHVGVDNGFQPYWPTVVVERRYVEEILDGLRRAGLYHAGDL